MHCAWRGPQQLTEWFHNNCADAYDEGHGPQRPRDTSLCRHNHAPLVMGVTSVGRVSQAAVLWLDSTLVGTEQALNTTEGTHRSA